MPSTVALILAIAAPPVISAWLWPFAKCRSCRGSGRSVGSNRHRWGICGRCGGTGKRIRLGARRQR